MVIKIIDFRRAKRMVGEVHREDGFKSVIGEER